MEYPKATRRYSDEEKRQLIANLDIEVAHRTRQFEAWLTDRLENFTMHQEGQVSRIPRQVRTMTMHEFGDKYDGNIQSALRGFQKERLAAAGADATLGEIDKSIRKRKWAASQDLEAEASGMGHTKEPDSQRMLKNARINPFSPKKVAGSSTGPGTTQRSRLLATVNKTPGTSRTMGRVPPSPSLQQSRPPFNNTTAAYNSRPPTRPASPLKRQPSNCNVDNNPQTSRVPSSSSFNPALPPKTPKFPQHNRDNSTATMRLPRKDENMLSVNGSPLANPYEFGLGWLKGVEMAQMDAEEGSYDATDSQHDARMLNRTKSSIIIRRDPSIAFSQNGLQSRAESQTSFYTAASQSQATSNSHSRENSQNQPLGSQPQAGLATFRFPSTLANIEATPRPPNKHARSFSALVAIPTKDGNFLEFDPLQTSPGALDALEGISNSAKKQAKVEMGRLIQATVDKWRIL